MGKIREFNKVSAVLIRDEVKKTLQELAEELGLFINTGSGTFSPSEFTIRLNISLQEGFDGKSGAQAEFERHSFGFGLKDKWFGKKFSYGGEIFTISGIRPKATKNPVLATNSKGKEFIFPVDIVKVMMVS